MAEIDNQISDELITEILTYVKLNLAIEDNSKDALLSLYIRMICNNILIKTNRRIFPLDLKYVVVDLVSNKFDANSHINTDISSIQSMTEEGRSISYGVTNTLATKLNLIAQAQLDENEKLIKQYRLVYKV